MNFSRAGCGSGFVRRRDARRVARASVRPGARGQAERELGVALANELRAGRRCIGVFDEGCMGMMNAIVEDSLMNPAGIYKERVSQSALFAAMREVTDEEARVRAWLDASGMKFATGPNEETDLTDAQILDQCRMYIGALRIADQFGCDAVGIQYQQGLKDLAPASDLVEGLLNNVERPPAYSRDGRELYAGKPLPHFNEVDECAGVDAVVTNRVWTAMGFDPATTLHDVRWGEHYTGNGIDEFVWLFQISGAVPAVASHRRLQGRGERAPAADVFPAGRRNAEGIEQAGRGGLEPRLCGGRQAATWISAAPRRLCCRRRRRAGDGAK